MCSITSVFSNQSTNKDIQTNTITTEIHLNMDVCGLADSVFVAGSSIIWKTIIELICMARFWFTSVQNLKDLEMWGSAVNVNVFHVTAWCFSSPPGTYEIICPCNGHYCCASGFCGFTCVVQCTVNLSSSQMTLAEMWWRCKNGPSFPPQVTCGQVQMPKKSLQMSFFWVTNWIKNS